MPIPPLELQGALQYLSATNLSAQGAANALIDAVVARSAAGGLSVPSPLTTFDQSANSTTATAVPAAVNVGPLVLLSDVIAAITTLQTAINTNTKLLNKVIDVMQAAGMAQ